MRGCFHCAASIDKFGLELERKEAFTHRPAMSVRSVEIPFVGGKNKRVVRFAFEKEALEFPLFASEIILERVG
jgi:hypothetical protein